MELNKEQATFIMDFIAFQDAKGKKVDLTRFANSPDFDKDTIAFLLMASKFVKNFKQNPEFYELLQKIEDTDVNITPSTDCFVERKEYGDPCHPSMRYVCRNAKNCEKTDCAAHYI